MERRNEFHSIPMMPKILVIALKTDLETIAGQMYEIEEFYEISYLEKYTVELYYIYV